MRTFTLLPAIVLVALQAKAEPVPPTDDVVPDQEWTDAGDQVMAISFAGAETSALQDPGSPKELKCRCRLHCIGKEQKMGECRHGRPKIADFCCVRKARDED